MMVRIPEGVDVSVDGYQVTVKGPNGEVQKSFSRNASVKVEGDEVKVSARDYGLQGTVDSLIGNMVTGVTEGYDKHMKLLYAHFPISVDVKENEVLFKNFLGEKEPRKAEVVGSTKVEAKGQNVTISGPDKYAVGQTAANMKAALDIRHKDPRIFQDGIYEVEEGA
ncbi:50S ribosomal protein L6 [Candidatus Micrarchaeota archaeon]|nr:50S ribosomal protein L6 [Candidatus Micrarchaeota archaeon]